MSREEDDDDFDSFVVLRIRWDNMTDEYDDEIIWYPKNGRDVRQNPHSLNLESEELKPQGMLYDEWLSYTDHEYFDYEMAYYFL